MLRRRFLQATPKPLFNDVEELTQHTGDYSLLRFSRRAMATHFEIDLPLGTPHAADAADAALNLIDKLEEQLTIYREDSEVSRLNATAFNDAVPVEPGLFKLLELAAQLTLKTQGAFDVACGALIKAWGFHRREGRIPAPAEHAKAMQASGMKHVLLNDGYVRFRRQNLELNLGSIGKGYALDRAGEVLRKEWQITNALLHAGGSSVLALGSPPNDSRGWPVAIQHPTLPGRTLGTLRLRNRALATSAATYQHFEYNGKKYGHVLDPRSGWPAETVASSSAIAATAAEADALATAMFVLGPSAKNFVEVGVILTDAASVTAEAFGFAPGEYEPSGLCETVDNLLSPLE